jgi:hypothetical protein
MSPISETESLQALNEIAAANREMADRVHAPGWYNWSLSLGMGGLLAVQEFPPVFVFAYEAAFLLLIAVLVIAYKRQRGVWIPGYRAGRTRWVAVGGATVYAAIMVASVYLRRELHIQGACLAGGVLLAALVHVHCWLWEKAYRRDLGVA